MNFIVWKKYYGSQWVSTTVCITFLKVNSFVFNSRNKKNIFFYYLPDIALLNRHLTSNALISKCTLVCTLVTVKYVYGQSGMSQQVPELLTNKHFSSPKCSYKNTAWSLFFLIKQASHLKTKSRFSNLSRNA